MKSKLHQSILACGTVIGTLIGTGLVSAEESPVSLTFAHMMPISNPQHACGVVAFEETISNAAVNLDLEVFPAGQTQRDTVEQIEAMMTGVIDITMASPAQIGTQLEKFAAFDLAYVFKDKDSMLATMGGPIAQEVFAELEEKSGIRIIGTGYAGTRHLTANKVIMTPADLAGVKLRVVNAPIWIDNGQALGAIPTPVSFGELYLALQQGVVDAQENPLPTIASNHFYEVQKYIMLTGHNIAPGMLLMSKESWNKLSAAQQATIDAAAAAWGEGLTNCTLEQEAQFLAEWSADGSVVEIIADVDKDAFMKAAAEFLLPRYSDKWDGLYARILEAQ
jgi:TRAP-type transport system periplasmic protein